MSFDREIAAKVFKREFGYSPPVIQFNDFPESPSRADPTYRMWKFGVREDRQDGNVCVKL